jgi:hypothetical protein
MLLAEVVYVEELHVVSTFPKPRPEEVARLVAGVLIELGGEVRNLADLNESILIDSGRYVARSYRADGFLAMWLIDAGIVQFYDAHGELLRTFSLRRETIERRAAA